MCTIEGRTTGRVVALTGAVTLTASRAAAAAGWMDARPADLLTAWTGPRALAAVGGAWLAAVADAGTLTLTRSVDGPPAWWRTDPDGVSFRTRPGDGWTQLPAGHALTVRPGAAPVVEQLADPATLLRSQLVGPGPAPSPLVAELLGGWSCPCQAPAVSDLSRSA